MPIGAFKLNSIGRYLAPVSSGRTAVTVTTNGNAQISTAQSKFGGASALFDGSGDYLQPATSTDLRTWNNATTGYTVEYWFRANSFTIGGSPSNYPLIVGNMNQGGDLNTWSFGPTSTTQITFYYYTGAQQRLNATVATMSTGTWYHFAFTYSTSGAMNIWFNGTSVASGTVTGTPTFNASAGLFVIGQVNNVGYNGYLDEMRISSTCRYNYNFTPHTGQFQNDSSTLLLLHMDGANASTSFTDDNSTTRSVTVTRGGNAITSTAQFKFGTASGYSDGVSDYLVAPAMNLGSQWTMEGWFRPDSPYNTTGDRLLFSLDNLIYMMITGAGNTIMIYIGGAASGATAITVSTWTHIAFVASGSGITSYVNGVSQATRGWTGFSTSDVTIAGANVATTYKGYFDEIRISNTQRYTGNFTPSASAFTNDSNTLLLLHLDGANNGTTFTDTNA